VGLHYRLGGPAMAPSISATMSMSTTKSSIAMRSLTSPPAVSSRAKLFASWIRQNSHLDEHEQDESVFPLWEVRHCRRISCRLWGFGTNELPKGSSLRFGGVNPVTTIRWIGGHLSLIAAASGSPIHGLGMLISVMRS
jgi:hypothetical protein